MAASDGHAKNYSLFLRQADAYAMTPLYGGPPTWQAMLAMIGQVEEALGAVESRLPRAFPGRTWETIQAGVRSQVHAFTAGLSELEGG